jgi:hypothetical protein
MGFFSNLMGALSGTHSTSSSAEERADETDSHQMESSRQKASSPTSDWKRLKGMTPYELGESGRKEAVELLIPFLRSGQTNERRLAASAVGKLADEFPDESKKALPYLVNLLSFNSPQVRQYSLKALSKFELDASQLQEVQKRKQEDSKEYNRKAAAAVLEDVPQERIGGNTSSKRDKRTQKIRLLGKEDAAGNLLTVREGKSREGTKLVKIEPDEIVKSLVMVYFPENYDEKQEKEVLGIIKGCTGSEFRLSTDRFDRKYWWRVTDNSEEQYGKGRRYPNCRDPHHDAMMEEKHPFLKNDPDAEHWIDLADDLGCDPMVIKQNLD